jgi:DNA-binding NarL/FixJ family response regulator
VQSVPDMKVLMLSMYDEQVYAERALKAGAMGFVMKEEAAERILEAIRCVASGKVFLSEAMTDRVLSRAAGHTEVPNAPFPEHLSDRELETLRLIGLGRSSREIAEQLHLSVKTVDNYKDRIKRKLNLRNASELARFAYDFVSK